jgi:protein TonB
LFNSFDLAGSRDALQVPEEVSEPVAITSQQDDQMIFERVESMPVFPGGDAALMKYLSDNVTYPELAAEKGIQGRVVLKFVVKADGTIGDVLLVKSLDPVCDKEAVRVIKKMPKWTPGKEKGKAVAVYYSLPILFKLNNDEVKK